MLFNSYAFILLFLPLTLGIFFLLSKLHKVKAASAFLVIASLFFYGYWDVKYIPLLIVSILFNYLLGCYIEKVDTKHKKQGLLTVGIGINILLLGYYKYTKFILTTINYFMGTSFPVHDIVLPLGISFFTFTQIAYLVDTCRGETKEYRFSHYALFVTIFPHLIAGPILYHKHVIPQFERLRTYIFSYKNMAMGFSLFSLGLFKKVLIADSLYPWVKTVFQSAGQASAFDAWVGALAYTFQIYFDFSGYSDMAVGLGLMLNIKLPINFNSPYKATSISQYWNRWHMTLSSFLRHYLYIPLGGNRCGNMLHMRNLFITMLLGGIWHGAGWTYIAWGAVNGIFVIINHLWRKTFIILPEWLARGITFISVVVTFVFFRAETITDTLTLLKKMFFLQHTSEVLLAGEMTIIVPALLVLLVIVNFVPNSNQLMERFRPNWKWAICTVLFLLLSLLKLDTPGEFLYFQF